MTVATTGNRYLYAGDDVTVAFSFPRLFLADADLLVILRVDATGVETVQTITTHYTLSGEGNPLGGTVTMVTAPATGESLLIVRRTDQEQNTAYATGGSFPAASHEAALDKLTLEIQDNSEKTDRSPKLAESTPSTTPTFPEPSAAKLIGWNDDGDDLENRDAQQWITGTGVPASSLGSIGDMYLDSGTGEIYGPKTAGGWGSVVYTVTATGLTNPLDANLDVGSFSIVSISAGDIPITPDTTGDLILDGVKWPQADGSNGQVLSTNGAGQTAWSTVAGSGDVIKVGTPVNNELGVWTGDGTIEGDTNLTWSGSVLDINGTITPNGINISTPASGVPYAAERAGAVYNQIQDTTATADERIYRWGHTGTSFAVQSVNDAQTVATTLLSVTPAGVTSLLASGSLRFGAISILDDSAGTTTLQNIDAIDATTETTLEAAIDSLTNLVTVGALDAGSITSNFGNIDIGASTFDTTGAVTTGAQTVTGSIAVTNNGATAGLISLEEPNGDSTVTLTAPALAASYTLTFPVDDGTASQFLQTDGAGVLSWATIAGGGDALVANPLSQFAATTSAQLAGVMSDETGSGAVVFATSPTLVTPALGTPASGVLTNATGYPGDSSLVTTGALNSGSITSGFGNIDIGASTFDTTGALTCGTFTSTGIDDNATAERVQIDDSNITFGAAAAQNAIIRPDTGGVLTLTGSNANNVGAGMRLHGSTAAAANDIEFRVGTTLRLSWDESESNWDFGGNAVINGNFDAVVSGKQTIWIPANAMVAPTTSGAADGSVELATNDVMLETFDFDTAADEYVQFSIAFPKSYDLGTVTFQAFWTVDGAVTTGVAWGLQALARADNEAIDAAWGTAVVVTDDAQGAANELLVSTESTGVTTGSADDDLTFFRLFRDVSDANDDMTQDAKLIGIKLFYTTDSVTDA